MFKEKIANFIIHARWYFFAIFLISAIGCAFLIPSVNVNYDITSYLPENSSTKVALETMEEEFGSSGSANVMVSGSTLTTEEVTNTILPLINNVAGVQTSLFTEDYFQNIDGQNYALIKIYFQYNDYSTVTQQAVEDIRTALTSYDIAMNGSAITASQTSGAVTGDMPLMILIAILVVMAILFLTSRSWLEPLIFFIVLSVAIVLNLGTNLLFPSISFVTNSICIILQLALSLDYSIILLHRFAEEQKTQYDPKKALANALAHCFSPISASGLTTIAGLVALVFMQFTIGFDLGLVLAKGILFSLLAVFLFMPSVLLIKPNWLEKTKHRPLLPKMTFLAGWGNKIKWIMPFAMIFVIIGAFILQNGMILSYSVNVTKEAQVEEDQEAITSIYGTTNTLVVIVQTGYPEKERLLSEYILSLQDDENEDICNLSQSMIALGTYDYYNKTQILALVQSLSGYTLTTEQQLLVVSMFEPLFTAQSKDIDTDSVYAIDLLTYIHQANIVSKLELVATYQEMHAELTMAQAQAIYGLDEDTVETIFYNVNGMEPNTTSTVEHYQILLQLRNMDIFSSLSAELQQTIISISGPLTYAQIMTAYQLGTTELNALGITTSSTNIQPIYVINYLYAHLNDSTTPVFCTSKQVLADANYNALLETQSMFESDQFSLLIFNLTVSSQSEASINAISQISDYIASNNLYGLYYIISDSAVMLDLEETFSNDVLIINLITALALFIIIMLAFRSLTIPILLVAIIQGAIWINMAFFSIIGTSLFFMCYIITLCIQMGATIDYGILLTSRYMENRKNLGPIQSMKEAVNGSIPTILTSGSILCFASLIIGLMSSADVISDIGFALCGGTIISVLMILFVLPSALLLCDKIIAKTTIKANFYFENAEPKKIKTSALKQIKDIEAGKEINLVDNKIDNNSSKKRDIKRDKLDNQTVAQKIIRKAKSRLLSIFKRRNPIQKATNLNAKLQENNTPLNSKISDKKTSPLNPKANEKTSPLNANVNNKTTPLNSNAFNSKTTPLSSNAGDKKITRIKREIKNSIPAKANTPDKKAILDKKTDKNPVLSKPSIETDFKKIKR